MTIKTTGETMKVILGKASASSNHEKYPKKEIHAMLMFVRTDDNDKAQKIAKVEMLRHNWNKVKLSRIGPVNVDTFDSEDEQIKEAFTTAMNTGFGLLVYPEIEKSLSL